MWQFVAVISVYFSGNRNLYFGWNRNFTETVDFLLIFQEQFRFSVVLTHLSVLWKKWTTFRLSIESIWTQRAQSLYDPAHRQILKPLAFLHSLFFLLLLCYWPLMAFVYHTQRKALTGRDGKFLGYFKTGNIECFQVPRLKFACLNHSLFSQEVLVTFLMNQQGYFLTQYFKKARVN